MEVVVYVAGILKAEVRFPFYGKCMEARALGWTGTARADGCRNSERVIGMTR